MNRILIFISLILILVISYVFVNTREDFTEYKRCDEKPVSGIMKKILTLFSVNKTNNDSYDLYIPCGYNGVERELKKLTIDNPDGKKIFGIDGCDKIVAKNNLWVLISNCYGLKKASKIMPKTCVLSNKNDMENFIKHYDEENIYILKKNLQRKQGIKLTKDLNEILNAENDKYKIVQQYIQSYIINKRKMNLRIYFLIVIEPDGSKKGYIHKIGKCLYTSKDVDESSNELVFEEHITNSYTMEKSIYNNSPQSLEDLNAYLSKTYKNPSALFDNIQKLFEKVFKCIKFSLGNIKNLEDTTRFQLFGADVIFDNSLTPYLLEINKGPDMKHKDPIDEKMKTKVFLDVFEKSKVITVDDNNYKNGFIELRS